jgi:hypothetical protein
MVDFSSTVLEILDRIQLVDPQAYAFRPAGAAVHECSYTGYTQISTELDVDDVKKMAIVAFQITGDNCYHEHDCCGCWFLGSLGVHQIDDGVLLIIEDWGRNL